MVYTPSSLGKIETGDVILSHVDLGDWVFQATGVGEMPGVMEEHRTVATVGTTTSTMFPFRLVTRRLIVCAVLYNMHKSVYFRVE